MKKFKGTVIKKSITNCLIFAIFLCFFSCQNKHNIDETLFKISDARIVGGEPVVNTEFPTVVGLTTRGKIFCSGTVVKSNIVYTAAHCFFHPKQFLNVVKYSLKARPNLVGIPQRRMFIEKLMVHQLQTKRRSVRVYLGNGVEGQG